MKLGEITVFYAMNCLEDLFIRHISLLLMFGFHYDIIKATRKWKLLSNNFILPSFYGSIPSEIYLDNFKIGCLLVSPTALGKVYHLIYLVNNLKLINARQFLICIIRGVVTRIKQMCQIFFLCQDHKFLWSLRQRKPFL